MAVSLALAISLASHKFRDERGCDPGRRSETEKGRDRYSGFAYLELSLPGNYALAPPISAYLIIPSENSRK